MRKQITWTFLFVLLISFNTGVARTEDPSQYVEPLPTTYLECSLEEKAQNISPEPGCPTDTNPSPVVLNSGRVVLANVSGEKKILVSYTDDLRTLYNYRVRFENIDSKIYYLTEVTLTYKDDANLFLWAVGYEVDHQTSRVFLLKSSDYGQSFVPYSIVFSAKTSGEAPGIRFSDAAIKKGIFTFVYSYPSSNQYRIKHYKSNNGINFQIDTRAGALGTSISGPKLQWTNSRLYVLYSLSANIADNALMTLRAIYSENGFNFSGDSPNTDYRFVSGFLGSSMVSGWLATTFHEKDRKIVVAYTTRMPDGSASIYYVSKIDNLNWTVPIKVSNDETPGISRFMPALASNGDRILCVFFEYQDGVLKLYGLFLGQGESFLISDAIGQNCHDVLEELGQKIAVVSYKTGFLVFWPDKDDQNAKYIP